MKTEALMAALVKEFPHALPVVLYQDKDGWYDWCPAQFWDDNRHEHFIKTRTELLRSNDLIEVFLMVEAYNRMANGQTHKQVNRS